MRYRDLSEQETEVLGLIATGNGLPEGAWPTIEKLVKRGLVHEVGRQVLGRDAFGEITVPFFEMPIPEHIAWCEWCSEQVSDE